MCVIEVIKYRTADGRIEEKAYTRICENGVSGKTCDNTVIRDSGLTDLATFTPPTGLYGPPSVDYPRDAQGNPSTMANDGLIARGPPSTIEVASTTDRKNKPGQKYLTRHPSERTSVLTSFFRGARDRVKEKKYRDSERPPAPEPPTAAVREEGAGAPPPPPPPQARRQSFSSNNTLRPAAPQFPPLDTAAANSSQAFTRGKSESSPITFSYTPSRRRVPPMVHQPQPQPPDWPSHFLPPGMSPTDSHFSSFSPSRDSSPFNTGFGWNPPSAPAYTAWRGFGTSPNTPVDNYPTAHEYNKQGRSSHQASQSQGKPHHRPDLSTASHQRSVSDGQAFRPTFNRKGSMRAHTKPVVSKPPPEVLQEPRNESDEEEPPRQDRRRRHKHSQSHRRERELEDQVAALKAELAKMQNMPSRTEASPASPTGTDRTVRPSTGSRSHHHSAPHDEAITSPSRTSGRAGNTQDDLLKRLEAMEARLAAAGLSPETSSAPVFEKNETSTTNPYAARVDDAEEDNESEENLTSIDSSESVQSVPRTPSPCRKPRDRPASVHLDHPFRIAKERMKLEREVSPKPSNLRKERMYQRAQDTRPSLQRSYSDRRASESRPSRRDEPSESARRDRSRESSHRHTSRHESRQSSQHRTRPESDSESTSRTVRRQTVNSGDESQSRRRLDRRDREELKRRGRTVWD